jgi:serine/threonine-protein kinase
VGTTLGSYRLLSILGEGGMGRVYLAEHTKLGRRVALKLLRAEQASRKNAVTRFFQEARVVNRVRHRNIVDIPDLVELDDGTVFIVMEQLQGRSLRELLRGDGAPAVGLAIEIGVQVCRALEAAHAVGVLHRDLKPANVHIADDRTGDAWVKLLDFGIAKLSEPEQEPAGGVTAPDITGEGAIIGTPIYMSPEQATASPVDPRTDIYSLGIILYEMVAGHPPFTGATMPELVWAHCSQSPPPFVVPVPPELESLIRRCLAKRPQERPASATAVREALLAIDARPPRRARWKPALAVALAALVAGAALAYAFAGGDDAGKRGDDRAGGDERPAAPGNATNPPAPPTTTPTTPNGAAPSAPEQAAGAAKTPPNAAGEATVPTSGDTATSTGAGDTRRRKPAPPRATREPTRTTVPPTREPAVAPAKPPGGGVRDPSYTVDPFRDEAKP